MAIWKMASLSSANGIGAALAQVFPCLAHGVVLSYYVEIRFGLSQILKMLGFTIPVNSVQ